MSKFDLTPSRSKGADVLNQFVTRLWRKSTAVTMAWLFAAFILILSSLLGSVLGGLARGYAQSNSVPVVTSDLPNLSITSVDSGNTGAQETVAAQSVELQTVPEEAGTAESQVNILLLGSDERIDGEEPPRTDTLLLLTLDLRRHTAGMISLPRDL